MNVSVSNRPSQDRTFSPRTLLSGVFPAILTMVIPLGLAPAVVQAQAPAATSDSPSSTEIQQSLNRGLTWLMSQQAADGGWHSTTYGKMKPGVGTTALILDLLSQLPPDQRERFRPSYERGVRFLKARLQPFIQGEAVPSGVDYPVYAAALLASALSRFPCNESDDLPRRLARQLLKSQRTVSHGWTKNHPDLGGWGAWMERPTPTPSAPANTSATALVLIALNQTGTLTPESKEEALAFLKRCQSRFASPTDQPGFVFTPDPHSPLNKAGTLRNNNEKTVPIAYHSATCDGVLALLAIGDSESDPILRDRLRTLESIPFPAFPRVPAEEDSLPNQEGAIFFSNAAAFARIVHQSKSDGFQSQRALLLKKLIDSQSESGHWQNPLPWFHEDDPLIATPFALLPLIHSMEQNTSPHNR